MSANQQEVRRGSQLVNNNVLRSQMATLRDKRLIPEDTRIRRFAYQACMEHMSMPAHLSGQQSGQVPPGKLVLFETTPVTIQNLSVDKEEQAGPAIEGTLLAGTQIANLMTQYEEVGFMELLPLRGLEDPEAESLFDQAHPPLDFAVEQRLIQPCIYSLAGGADQEYDADPLTGRREVCGACRQQLITVLLNSEPSSEVAELLEVLRLSVDMGVGFFTGRWNGFKGEIRSGAPGPREAPRAKELNPGMLYIMRQVHGRTPEDLHMAEVTAGARASAAVVQQAMAGMQPQPAPVQVVDTEAIKAQLREEMREEMRQMAAEQKQAEEVASPAAAEKKTAPKKG